MTARLLSLQDVSSARAYYQAGHWQDYTLYQRLAYWAGQKPGSRALVDCASTITYSELRDWVDIYAAHLFAAGLRVGDRVAIWAPSRMESVIVLLACSRMGYVCIPSLHRDHTPGGVIDILTRTRAAALVFERGYGANLSDQDIAAETSSLPHIRHVVELPPTPTVEGSEVRLFGNLENRPIGNLEEPSKDPDRVMYLAFTSGTTGDPKGVMHSDNTLLSNGRGVARDFNFDEDTVVYTLSPMSHNMGTVSLCITLVCGGTLILHGSSNAANIKERIIATGATYLVGVPTHGIDLVAQLGEGEKLGKVRCFQLAGAPVPLRLAKALIARGITIQNCYGMTENCSFLYTRPTDSVDTITGTCGRCSDGMEIAILDAEDSDSRVDPGKIGEVGIRGPSMMLGYFNNQMATENSYNREGWFLSGDLGVEDHEGNFAIVGRKKDLIIRGGHNIHPAPVENHAMRHPAIHKAAAFGVADTRLGEKMCLAVILEENAVVDWHEVLDHMVANGLSSYDLPEYVVTMADFPLTASGKILKRELAVMATDGRLSPTPIRWRKPVTVSR